jgi:hypothetical protein
MLCRIKDLKEDVYEFIRLSQDDMRPFQLSEEEWRQIDYLIEILYPFALYTDAIGAVISGPTVHNVFAVYNKLFGHIESHIEKLKRKRVTWKVTMRHGLELANDKLSTYYSKTKDSIGYIYGAATVLAPQYKLAFFEGEDWEDGLTNWVRDLIIVRYNTCD